MAGAGVEGNTAERSDQNMVMPRPAASSGYMMDIAEGNGAEAKVKVRLWRGFGLAAAVEAKNRPPVYTTDC